MEEAIAGFIAYVYGIYLQWSPPVNEMAMYLYNSLFFPILFFSSMFYLMAFTGIFSNPKPFPSMKVLKWPKVTIQIPTKNEIVALRCAKRCLNFNYPKDMFDVIIGDDSNNPAISKAIDDFAKK